MEERLLAILRLALKYKATDIHFTLRYQQMKIEMRIDEQMRKVKGQPEDFKLLRFLQYLANLDVGNLLEPQTGQFEMQVDEVTLSLRFAIINSFNFSNGVLRILNPELKIDADHLSSLKRQNRFFRSLLKRPYGLVLFSGPTGSGKTTTLYSLLSSIEEEKVFTIEDPIEVYNDRFVQLQVNEKIGFDYAAGIRQILRHDPDIIMIGEIRDEKAAKMAVVAANTGHLVLSTIHASKACSCISRMTELGVNEEHLYEVLLCVSNQRMVIHKNTKLKTVLYEIMDEEEIGYFRKNHHNSPAFLDIRQQYRDGVERGIYEDDSV